jgi:hypothetical protein
MQTRNKALLISLAAVVVICAVGYTVLPRLAAGFIAGYAAGILNYYLISSQVKKNVTPAGNVAAKVTSGIFFYFLRLFTAALIIAAVLKASKYYSIGGFLAGFTLCVAMIFAAHKIYENKNVK